MILLSKLFMNITAETKLILFYVLIFPLYTPEKHTMNFSNVHWVAWFLLQSKGSQASNLSLVEDAVLDD